MTGERPVRFNLAEDSYKSLEESARWEGEGTTPHLFARRVVRHYLTHLDPDPAEVAYDATLDELEACDVTPIPRLTSDPQRQTPHFTDTAGWSADQFLARLTELEQQLLLSEAESKRWLWDDFLLRNREQKALVVRLAEELVFRGTTISRFLDACRLCEDGGVDGDLAYLDYTLRKEQAQQALKEDRWDEPVSSGPVDPDTRLKLEEAKAKLDWGNTTGGAQKFWVRLEEHNSYRLDLVLAFASRLAREKPRLTITEFFIAYIYACSSDCYAALHYCRYCRFKKAAEKKAARTAHQ